MRCFTITVIFLALISACSPEQGAGNELSDERADAIYMDRFEAQAERRRQGLQGISAYDPLEPVAGAEQVEALPLNPAVSANMLQALQASRRYTSERNSSALLVWHSGALIEASYFGATTKDTLINAKSLAKPLGAIAIGTAIARGHIRSLDQSAADFFEEWQGSEKELITIRHLLGMRSGLLPQGFVSDPAHILNRVYLHPKHDDLLIGDYPLVDTPSTTYEYSNANGELIGPLIERATGQTYQDWVSQQVLKPMGASGGDIWVNRQGGTAHSGCCILLPAETYVRLAVLLLEDGVIGQSRLLPAGFVKEMRTVDSLNPHAGLAVFEGHPFAELRGSFNPETVPNQETFHSEPYATDDIFLFDGNGNQVIYIMPELDLVVARLGGTPPAETGWDNAFLPNAMIRGLAPPPNAQSDVSGATQK